MMRPETTEEWLHRCAISMGVFIEYQYFPKLMISNRFQHIMITRTYALQWDIREKRVRHLVVYRAANDNRKHHQ